MVPRIICTQRSCGVFDEGFLNFRDFEMLEIELPWFKFLHFLNELFKSVQIS